ncbi:ribosome silencing factor [Wolbachia endosymbiont of Cruorifilaria tuberocauda]|uniref:ribosome silencing factor n=1 Tax=Wolbachia endosymbiont of Cruorifilaria tuberocauda TaxID=1812111 RepID=UPI00158999BE|nr:ribosome silencing factor [Wolbachia endosymbiont of Cruorifilaria tuberocauda]QKX01816.1 ribosome silencing factor [Wolbachia endosymbiont of Cruorifilaria tuberocauda]
MESVKDVIVNIISQNKGHDIVTFNVQNKTVIAKYMVIASGSSSTHVKALAKYIIKSLKQHGKIDVEGIDKGNWVIINFRSVMVHIFKPEVREFYRIEELWG